MSVGLAAAHNLDLISSRMARLVSPVVYRNWIAALSYGVQNDTLMVYTLDDFHTERIKREYLSKLQEIAQELFPNRFTQIKVEKKSGTHAPQQKTELGLKPVTPLPSAEATIGTEEIAKKTSQDIQELIRHQRPPPHSQCNDLLMKIIEDLTKNPHAYDSIYIYGPAGSGKSTYIQFLFRCLSRVMSLPTGYYTMDDFTSEMVEAIQSQSIYKFRKKFKEKFKAVIIDDFHLIAKRCKTQEELAHMVHAWKSDGIKVFFISQNPIEACVTNQLLLARIQSGLVIPIEAPDFSLIEQMVVNEIGDLSSEVRHGVVQCCHNKITSLHTLKGIINRIRVEVSLCKRTLDLASIEKIVEEFIVSGREEDLRPVQIIQLVCQYYQVEEEMLRSKSRKKTLSEARRLCAYLLRKYSELSLMDIGALISRDHTTVLHAVQKVEGEIKTLTPLCKHVKFLEEKIAATVCPVKKKAPAQRSTLTLH